SETKKAGQREFESLTLNADRQFAARIEVQNGKWAYVPANGAAIRSDIAAGSQWHDIVLSHYTARGETLFFVDGKLAGRIAERLQPGRFSLGLGGPAAAGSAAPQQADYKDLSIFR